MPPVSIIGGGLAGCEAAWQLLRAGIDVDLFEARPAVQSPAHRTLLLGELVCSNSLRSDAADTAPGLLKAELRLAGSLVMACAEEARLPAGVALAVDRELFAARVTSTLERNPFVEIVREEVTAIPDDGPAIVAAGPLCSEALARAIAEESGIEMPSFFGYIVRWTLPVNVPIFLLVSWIFF